MPRAVMVLLLLLPTISCGLSPNEPAEEASSDPAIAFDLGLNIDFLCQGMQRRIPIQIAWLSETSPPSDPPTVFWTSLTPEVIAVSETGLVTTLGPGEGRIVAEAGWAGHRVSEEVSITVRAGDPVYDGGRELSPGVMAGGTLRCGRLP